MNTYNPEFSWNKDTEYWLKLECKGFILNFPCGMSQVGDVRVDIDKAVKPDVIADYNHPPFRDMTFDTVVCDPIFKDYYIFPRLFINKLALLCKSKLIFSSPLARVAIKRKCFSNYKRRFKITCQGTLALRLWQIFEKQTLDEFSLI